MRTNCKSGALMWKECHKERRVLDDAVRHKERKVIRGTFRAAKKSNREFSGQR